VIEKMPKLAAHLSSVQCDITIVATDWFLCLFCTTLPSEVRQLVLGNRLFLRCASLWSRFTNRVTE